MKKTFLLPLIFLLSCSSFAKSSPSILEVSNCELPCWNNIIPGETSESDAVTILTNLPLVKKGSVQMTNIPWKVFDNTIRFESNQDFGLDGPQVVDLIDGKVAHFYLCGDLGITIDDVTERTGEPQSLIIGSIIHGEKFATLINQKVGIAYWYILNHRPDNSFYQMTPDIQVECISSFDPTLYQTMLEAGMFSMGTYDAEGTAMYPWNGYGNLLEKYPPP